MWNTFVLEEDDEDEDRETEKNQAYLQWPRGDVVRAMAQVKHAPDVIGDKKQSMSKEEFQNLISSTPVAVLALKRLDKTPAQFRAMTRMPKQDNLKKLFEKFIAVCEDVENFYDFQPPPASVQQCSAAASYHRLFPNTSGKQGNRARTGPTRCVHRMHHGRTLFGCMCRCKGTVVANGGMTDTKRRVGVLDFLCRARHISDCVW